MATYQYDGQNRRVVKTTTAETRHFYYSDRWQDVEERIGSNTTANLQYVWGQRYFDELVCRDDASGNRLYACQDANFNLTAITDASGTVQERYVFDPYGSRLIVAPAWTARAASSYGWTVGHQGLMTNSENGLYSNRLRDLHPMLGRFTSRDSIGFAAGANFYLYEDACPTTKVDPTGNSAADCCGPDVSGLLAKISADVAQQYATLTFTQKLRIGGQTTIPHQAMQAWDIAQLFNSTANNKGCSSGTGKCVGTVTVNGQCYQQIAVNYWLAGLFENAFESSFWTQDFANVFRTLVGLNVLAKGKLGLGDPVYQKFRWFYAGRNNLPNVSQDPAYAKCDPCQAPVNHLDWTWRFLRGTVR